MRAAPSVRFPVSIEGSTSSTGTGVAALRPSSISHVSSRFGVGKGTKYSAVSCAPPHVRPCRVLCDGVDRLARHFAADQVRASGRGSSGATTVFDPSRGHQTSARVKAPEDHVSGRCCLRPTSLRIRALSSANTPHTKVTLALALREHAARSAKIHDPCFGVAVGRRGPVFKWLHVERMPGRERRI